MADKLSWLNPRSIKAATDLWGSDFGRQPILFFSYDDPEVLHARLEARDYWYPDYNEILDPVRNKAPTGMTITESMTFNDEGCLRIACPKSHNETLYPALDNKQVAEDGKLRSFAVVVFDARQYHVNAYFGTTDEYPFAKVPQLYLVGSVGEYQSGADVEFESLDKWSLGRPLYIENNVLDTPFKILR